jgi:hypothetical protein
MSGSTPHPPTTSRHPQLGDDGWRALVEQSGFTDGEIVRRGLLAPDAPYLQKPFDARRLGQRLREAVDAHRSAA